MSETVESKEQEYRELGLETEVVTEPAGFTHEKHSHEETYLYVVAGSANITLESETIQAQEGQQVVVGEGVEHEVVAGPNGWTYLAGWRE